MSAAGLGGPCGVEEIARMRVGTAFRGGLLVLLAAVFALVGLTASALAGTGHRYVGQFSSPGSALGELSGPSGLAVRQSSGDVYVLDQGNGRVERFDAAGNYLSSFNGSSTPAEFFFFPSAIAVDQSSGDVYVADTFNNAVDVFSAAGSYLSQLDASATPATVFSSPSGVAVDPGDGTVYVSDTGDNVVDVFDNTGAFVTSFDGSAAGEGPFVSPAGLAVDGGHRVYVFDSGKARVEQYTAQGAAFTSIFDSNSPVAVAADPGSSEVYVAENGGSGVQVSELTSAGVPISTFGAGHIAATSGLGVNSSTGTLYVADQANSVVERFAAFTTPTVTTEGSSGVSATEATVAGTINPEGAAGTTNYRFDYGLDTNYGASSTETDTGGGSADVEASATLTGLAPGTTYHYRLFGTNQLGTSAGSDQTFTTEAAQPSVDVQAPFASSITTTGATLNDTLNPNGADTTATNTGPPPVMAARHPTPTPVARPEKHPSRCP
jgi:DNA-binding beta-propeller fold protein YncE